MELKKAYSICLQGNIIEAIDYLKSIKNKNQDVIKLEERLIGRFINRDEDFEIASEDLWIRTVLNCYYDYFLSVLTNHSVKEAEEELTFCLRTITKVIKLDLDEIELNIKSVFDEKGYSFLGGVTAPYRGPYIWKTTSKADFIVELPTGKQKVTVFFLSGFLMLSWAHFATFGEHHTGGWATKDGLYYVNNKKESVDIESVDFQVWFLKHEAQHLSDNENYPDLDAINLEYRAKLIELIYNPDSQSLLEKFTSRAKNDRSLPHSYAAYLIINVLSATDDIPRKALELFEESEMECIL